MPKVKYEQKYHAIARGRRTGVFKSRWTVEKLTADYEGCLFKSFTTQDEATAWLAANSARRAASTAPEAAASTPVVTGVSAAGVNSGLHHPQPTPAPVSALPQDTSNPPAAAASMSVLAAGADSSAHHPLSTTVSNSALLQNTSNPPAAASPTSITAPTPAVSIDPHHPHHPPPTLAPLPTVPIAFQYTPVHLLPPTPPPSPPPPQALALTANVWLPPPAPSATAWQPNSFENSLYDSSNYYKKLLQEMLELSQQTTRDVENLVKTMRALRTISERRPRRGDGTSGVCKRRDRIGWHTRPVGCAAQETRAQRRRR